MPVVYKALAREVTEFTVRETLKKTDLQNVDKLMLKLYLKILAAI